MRRALPLAVTALSALAGTAALVQLGRAAWGVPSAMGASSRTVLEAVRTGKAFDGKGFVNRLPSTVLTAGSIPVMIRNLREHKDKGKPVTPVPVRSGLVPPAAASLAATWFGHASVLIEIDGARVLADPVWSDRVSPSRLVGPHRMHPVPPAVDQLPPVDAVIISHDHYDHLDLPTVRALVTTQDAPFVVPLGIGSHLRRWGVPEHRIVELDWDGSTRIGDITLTCTEARHFSGRAFRRNSTLWSSWAIRGPHSAVYFGGDTGYTPAFAEIGARLGPFDLTLLPIGAYAPQWPDIHMDPEDAWRAHGDLGGGILLPIHWATFDLAFHTWVEPVERLLAAAGGAAASQILIPRPGERVEPAAPPAPDTWWERVAGR